MSSQVISIEYFHYRKRQTNANADSPVNKAKEQSGKDGTTQIVAQQLPAASPNQTDFNSAKVVTNQGTGDEGGQNTGNKNMKAIVTAALIVVSILLVLFIFYLLWRTYKRHLRKKRRRRELEEEARESREAEVSQSTLRPPPPVLTVRIESETNTTKTTMSASRGPSTPSTMFEHSPILRPPSMALPLNESCSSSSFRGVRRPIQTRPSGLSLNTTASMLSNSERYDTCESSTPITSPNYDENAYRLSRAMQSSPAVSALLSESFDTQAVRRNGKKKEGDRSFDWNQCEFQKEEEAAMWLPDLQRDFSQGSHNRSISEPSPTGIASDRRNALVAQENILSPISCSVDDVNGRHANQQVDGSNQVEFMASSAYTSPIEFHKPMSPNAAIVPYSPRAAATLCRQAMSQASESAHQSMYNQASRQRQSSYNVLPTHYESDQACDHYRPPSSVLSDSECSTETLRRAGALAIRNSNSSLNLGEISSSLSSPTSIKSRQKDSQYPPSASKTISSSRSRSKKGFKRTIGRSNGQKDQIELVKMGSEFGVLAT